MAQDFLEENMQENQSKKKKKGFMSLFTVH